MTVVMPEFDAEAFGSWLRRWREAEGLEWGQISERSGLHTSTLNGLAQGQSSSQRQRGKAPSYNPPINTLARLAYGLGLELPYVLSKAKIIDPADAGRWSNFSDAERVAMARALAVVPEQLRTPVEVRLLSEVLLVVPTNTPNNPEDS